MRINEVFDTVILGGGLTGYAAGILMTRAGMRVAVVEGLPWEWWHRQEGSDSFANHSGAVLYGVPGHQPVNDLLMQVGIPLNQPSGEGGVTFQTLEPGFQVLLHHAWVNLFPGPGELLHELERVFPTRSVVMHPLMEQSQKYHQQVKNYWQGGPLARSREGRTSLSVFLDSWARYWSVLTGGQIPSAAQSIAGMGRDPSLAEFARLLVFGLTRRTPKEASAWELYEWLEMLSKPACIINETGQRGILLCLRGSFQKSGGVVYRSPAVPECGREKESFTVAVGGRHLLLGRWLVLDGPEDQLGDLPDRWLPKRRKNALRPALHLTVPVPWESIPAGMSGHLIMNLDQEGEPVMLTLSPGGERGAGLEILTSLPQAASPDDQAGVNSRLLGRVRRLLRFLPKELPPPMVRRGHFPAFYGRPGLLERFRFPGPCPWGSNMHREGNCILVGRGEYLGSGLHGSLVDGQSLALRLIGSRRS